MSFLARTYSCGNSGKVRKLIDLVGSWADVSLPSNGIPGAANASLLDIKTDPTNGDKVFTVGEGFCSTQAFNWYGIAVSSNGGNAWQVPGGNYQAVVNENCYHKWIEVSVVDTNTIYVCGIIDPITRLGTVAKSIDGGLTFNMCSLLPLVLNNQDCTSIHFTSPLIGVVGLDNYVVKTVDGGITWVIMNGGLPLSTNNPIPGTALPVGPITGIFISANQGYVIGVGLGFIIETTPSPFPVFTAGMNVDTWQKNNYPPGGFGVPIGEHLTYLSPSTWPFDIIGVSGANELGLSSTNGGVNWAFAPAPGYQLLSPFDRNAAHFYKLNSSLTGVEGFYNKDNKLYSNNLGFNDSVEILSDTAPYKINAVWTWYEEQVEVCYALVACDGSTIITSTNMSSYLSPTLYFHIVGDPRCFFATYAVDCVGAIPVVVTGPTYSSCVECDPQVTCFSLTDCSGQFAQIITNTDVTQYLNQIVQLDTYPGVCWQVASTNNCDTASPLIGTVTLVFDDCISCLKKCYKLTDCLGTAPDIITDVDLSFYESKVIKILSQPNVCWLVTLSDTCTGSVVIQLSESFETCAICLALPEIPFVPLKTRSVQPGYGVGLCSVEYVEKINCAFANQVYANFINKKYGVDQCIENEFDKYLVKKSILDLNLIYDPDACIVPVVAEVCPEIPLVVPTPIPCMGPSSVTTEIVFEPVLCPAPTSVSTSIVYQNPNV